MAGRLEMTTAAERANIGINFLALLLGLALLCLFNRNRRPLFLGLP